MNHISFISSPPAIDVHISKKLRIIIYTNNTGAAFFFFDANGDSGNATATVFITFIYT